MSDFRRGLLMSGWLGVGSPSPAQRWTPQFLREAVINC
ncbi:hypothetical protein SynBIOSE41_02855 [Synechococcus sp. BIOS-E4-1]|nr:hypothetical protein SynBIOSE41_02855 [Synechococcus sp. BIOS-E4-1]